MYTKTVTTHKEITISKNVFLIKFLHILLSPFPENFSFSNSNLINDTPNMCP